MASSEAELKEVRKSLRATRDERDAAHQELSEVKAALKATGEDGGGRSSHRERTCNGKKGKGAQCLPC
jgi:hypothetical protein